MTPPPVALLVDDEFSLRDIVRQELEDLGLQVMEASSALDAMGVLRDHEVDLVLTDVRMPGESGTWLCKELSRLHPHVPVIVMTGYGNLTVAVEALRAGAYDFLSKPFKASQLEAAVKRALEATRMRREIRHLRRLLRSRHSYGRLIGQSPSMRRVFDLIDRVAVSSAPVLIQGESGVGKELVARAIHEHSRFRDGPFVAVNCAALPAGLIESELFGHSTGAFTDARGSRYGLFREAGEGTLFLDEIGELPLEIQPKLLRVLQERSLRPLGSDREHPFQARVIAATNRDLADESHQGTFRADLFYRIAVVVVAVPALRERLEDVPLLAEHFLANIVQRESAPEMHFSEASLAALQQCRWPGNVRELKNAIEHAFMMAFGNDEIEVGDLPGLGPCATTAVKPPIILQHALLATVEKRHILATLEALDGNKSHAARVLGIDRKTLSSKLKKYGPSGG